MGINEERNKRMARYALIPKHSGKVLDVSGNSGADGAPLLQWDWNGGDNQQWLLAGVGPWTF
jgi:Ricin-type beta-trefoil lectin domain-like